MYNCVCQGSGVLCIHKESCRAAIQGLWNTINVGCDNSATCLAGLGYYQWGWVGVRSQYEDIGLPEVSTRIGDVAHKVDTLGYFQLRDLRFERLTIGAVADKIKMSLRFNRCNPRKGID